MTALLTSKQFINKFKGADLSSLPGSNPSGGKPWLNNGFISVGNAPVPEQQLTFNAPLVRSVNSISLPAASGSQNGYLSSSDWTTFNSKQAAIGYTPANDSNVVHTTGNETIAGNKTFTGNVSTGSQLTIGNGGHYFVWNGSEMHFWSSPLVLHNELRIESGAANLKLGPWPFTAGLFYNSAGQLDIRGDNGLRVRSWANSADAPISAGAATFSGEVTSIQFNGTVRASNTQSFQVQSAGGNNAVVIGNLQTYYRNGYSITWSGSQESTSSPDIGIGRASANTFAVFNPGVATYSTYGPSYIDIAQQSGNWSSYNFSSGGINRAAMIWDPSRGVLGFRNNQYSGNDLSLWLASDGSLNFRDGAVYNSSPVFTVSKTGAATFAGNVNSNGQVASGMAGFYTNANGTALTVTNSSALIFDCWSTARLRGRGSLGTRLETYGSFDITALDGATWMPINAGAATFGGNVGINGTTTWYGNCRISPTGSGGYNFDCYSSGLATWQTGLRQEASASGIKMGFFNATPALQVTGGASTASGTYGSTEQTMLQTLWNMARAYGLLT